ncbi:NADH:flavin oxidoreductase [Cupriavidus pauculus]|uniref:NADH:flavin oxidoreductase n=1 Tax=Cupriavidus pauculus TaxID=82633 RepID=A0A5P2HE42_9BURK|nr:NADH:flavin oxidoreductase [Cupriavidus pauculus]QET05290.1 NADH:flavin oxidoreductase [Cupriavidus pauculus]
MSAGRTLFDAGQLGTLPLANRIAVAPMTRISATESGVPTDTMRRYYAGYARGGFGLLVTEGIYTDRAWSQGYAGQPGLTDGEQASGWRMVTDAAHAEGGRIVAQLMHAGALAQGNRFRADTIGPSAVTPRGQQMTVYAGNGPYATPRAMTEADIDAVIDGFVRAARLARDVAGFDGVEIHGANGYLIDQFLTAHTNLRDDAWGGTIDRRARLAVQIVRAVREAVGRDFTVGIRISQGKVNDFTHKWPEGVAGAHAVFRQLAEAGIDYLHVTAFEAWQPAFADDARSLVQLAREAVRDVAPGVAIVANGGLHDPARAAEALAQGADIVALGRGALANHDWPRRVREGIAPREFDPALLSPLGDIKPAELAARA